MYACIHLSITVTLQWVIVGHVQRLVITTMNEKHTAVMKFILSMLKFTKHTKNRILIRTNSGMGKRKFMFRLHSKNLLYFNVNIAQIINRLHVNQEWWTKSWNKCTDQRQRCGGCHWVHRDGKRRHWGAIHGQESLTVPRARHRNGSPVHGHNGAVLYNTPCYKRKCNVYTHSVSLQKHIQSVYQQQNERIISIKLAFKVKLQRRVWYER